MPQIGCPNVLAHGSCSDVSCRFDHNIVTCEPCGRVFPIVADYHSHVKGKQHLKRVQGISIVYSCPICRLNVAYGQRGWTDHISTRKHRSKATALGLSDVDPQPAEAMLGTIFCDACQSTVPSNDWDAHLKNSRHKSKETYVKYRAVAAESEKDKNGLVIDGDFDFGFVDPEAAANGYKASATVKTSDPFSRSSLVEIRLASSQGVFSGVSAYVFDSSFVFVLVLRGFR